MTGQEEQKKKIEELNRNFRECFSSKAGKKVLEYLEETYHIHETTFRGEVQAIAYSEGQRTVVLDIRDKMTIEQKGEQDD